MKCAREVGVGEVDLKEARMEDEERERVGVVVVSEEEEEEMPVAEMVER